MLDALLQSAQWAAAAYSCLSSPRATLANTLGIEVLAHARPGAAQHVVGDTALTAPPRVFCRARPQQHAVIFMQPETGSVKGGRGGAVVVVPAFYIAVSSSERVVRMVVRGTSQLADLVTDFCGHTTPFGGGEQVQAKLEDEECVCGWQRLRCTLRSCHARLGRDAQGTRTLAC